MPVVANMSMLMQNPDGSAITFPMTSGLKPTPMFQPNVIPAGYYFYGTGAFDDTATAKRGEGSQIALLTGGTPGDEHELVGRFFDHVYVLGGQVVPYASDYQDWVSLLLRAPASAPEDRTTTHDGNANKVSVGPFNVIVPAPGNDGDWDVDGATMEAGEINLGLCPIPAGDPDEGGTSGWWDWDPAASPSITPNLTQTGGYNLFDAALPLARQANRYPAGGAGDVTPTAAVKGKKILPHWEWVFTLHQTGAAAVKLAIRLDTARAKTL